MITGSWNNIKRTSMMEKWKRNAKKNEPDPMAHQFNIDPRAHGHEETKIW